MIVCTPARTRGKNEGKYSRSSNFMWRAEMKIDRENFLRFPPTFFALERQRNSPVGSEILSRFFPQFHLLLGITIRKREVSKQEIGGKSLVLSGGRTNQLEELSKSKDCLALS
jgi:hypothetical protein